MVRALACHVGDLGSIPGVCLYFILFLSHLVSKKVEFKTFLNPFSLNVQRLYCFYYIHIRSQNPIEKSFVMLFEVTNLKWIRLGGALVSSLACLTSLNTVTAFIIPTYILLYLKYILESKVYNILHHVWYQESYSIISPLFKETKACTGNGQNIFTEYNLIK